MLTKLDALGAAVEQPWKSYRELLDTKSTCKEKEPWATGIWGNLRLSQQRRWAWVSNNDGGDSLLLKSSRSRKFICAQRKKTKAILRILDAATILGWGYQKE
jgi:hypothetical protein